MVKRSSWPFIIVLAIELLLSAVLIAKNRGIVGHDAFQYFGLQYYFLNNAASAGETAQWMPFMTHGTVSNWWYSIQAGLVQSALLSLGSANKLLEGVDFLPIYYAGMLFDLAVYLLGICLLSRRFFSSDWTILFVAITSLGSTLPYTQPWYGLHFIYALPLIFEFLHRLFEFRRWRHAWLAGTLLAMQGLGNLPYQMPVMAMVVVVYLATYVGLYRDTSLEAARELRSRWKRGLLVALGVAGTCGLILTVLKLDTSEIANYNIGRNPDGTVASLESFLNYGNNRWSRWFEVLTRVSIYLDYNVYYGAVAAGFTALSLWSKPPRIQVLVLIPTAVIFLISLGGPLATVCYYAVPMMKYYRHLTLASVMARMLLAFLAGFGFERFLVKRQPRPSSGELRLLAIVSLVLAATSVLLLTYAAHPKAPESMQVLGEGFLSEDSPAVSSKAIYRAMIEGSASAFCAAVLIAALAFPRFVGGWSAPLVIVFQALDLYAFKAELAATRTLPLTAQEREINRLQPAPYALRRAPVDYGRDPRGALAPQLRTIRGQLYWSTDSYLFADPPSNLGRTDHWLKPLDAYLRVMHGDPLEPTAKRPTAFQQLGGIRFPEGAAAKKLSGVTEDKIQFFSNAYAMHEDQIAGQYMRQPEFSGDLLLVHLIDGEPSPEPVPPPPIDRNDRVRRTYRVTRFDANAVDIEIPDAQAGDWLYYANVWHPNWSAVLNGQSVPLFRANLAYEAVRLQGGFNRLSLRYRSYGFAVSSTVLNWISLFWVVFLLSMMAAECRGVLRKTRTPVPVA